MDGAGEFTLDGVVPLAVQGIQLGGRLGQHLGIGVGGVLEDGLGGAHLHVAAQVHHHHPVGDVAHHPQIVGDEQHRQLQLPLELGKQIDDLGLDGYVQGGYRLVRHNKGGVEGEGPGNADALALAAGELTGKALGDVHGQSAHGEELLHPGGKLLGRHHLVYPQHLGDGVVYRHTGVERGIGVLEDHLHLGAEPAERIALHVGDVRAVEADGAAGGLIQPENGAGQGGLAAARLAHQTQVFPLEELEGHVVDSLEVALLLSLKHIAGRPLQRKPFAQVFHLQQQGTGISHGGCPPFVRCRPAPQSGPGRTRSRPGGDSGPGGPAPPR